jgi:hypothetical protein
MLMVAFAITRTPGLLPENFSAAYAIAFCAGVFFPKRMAWWIPCLVLLVTDLALNCYYQFSLGYACFTVPVLVYMIGNYVGYGALIWLGKRFSPKTSFVWLLSGGLLGAIAFYLITNTLSWLLNPFHNPEYTKNLAGWLIAMTKGTGGWPETWTFFRNTLLSGGLFTGLFVGAVKMNEESAKEEETEEESEESPEPASAEAPKEAGA